jgi:hypothetical protein
MTTSEARTKSERSEGKKLWAKARKALTDEKLLHGRQHVDAVGDLKLVDLELDPFAEALEGRHCGGGRGTDVVDKKSKGCTFE